MQNNPSFSPTRPHPHPANLVGNYIPNGSMASIFAGKTFPLGSVPLVPLSGVEARPFEAGPRNFIIFDQTNEISQMFHTSIGATLCYTGAKVEATGEDTFLKRITDNDMKEITSSWKEDSADIDALLSIDWEENEYDDEEISTARTNMNSGCKSPDSCSNYDSPPRKFRKTTSSDGKIRERKSQRVRKMVQVLKGIVPGATQMNTVAVLDEAVQYLKSLKVEMQKLGLGK